MKRNNLRKIILLVFIIMFVLVLAGLALASKKNEQLFQNHNQWKVRAPELFNNAGYKKLFVKSSMYLTTNEYIGKVTNPFGIRDDVLDFIVKTFPNNESATYAAISIERDDVMIFRSSNDEDIMSYANSPAIWCLGNIIGAVGLSQYIDQIDKIRLSTNEGRAMDSDIRKKLGWKIFGFGNRTKHELNEICDKGNY